MNSYKGNIMPESDTVFVFGSNPEGRHGAGSAKVAYQKFGAEYGIGEGYVGQSYALPTTDLKRWHRPSMSEDTIIDNIKRMYECAKEHPDKKFKVAYRNQPDEITLCGYSGREMINMFKKAGYPPSNVYFSEEWVNNWD